MISIKINHRVGYACTPIKLPYRTSRSFTLKNFSENSFNAAVRENLEDLLKILQWNFLNDILMFRISSDIIPFGSHENNNLKWWITFKEQLELCGLFIKNNNIRVSMHPGQYTVLNSKNNAVVEKSIKDLEYHCKFLDSLNVDYTNKIVLHVGGVYNDKRTAINNFINNFQRLSHSLKNRLVLENDDKSYTIEEVLYICNVLKIPAVFDNLHHKLNPCDLSLDSILKQVQSTWKPCDGAVKFHYSDQNYEKKNGSHSKFVITENFLSFFENIKNLNSDIMLEVKDKEISACKCVKLLQEKPPISVRYEEWAKYKYLLMEKNYDFYKKCSSMVNSEVPLKRIYEYIEKCMQAPFSCGNFINAAEHVYGYIKNETSPKEKETFKNLMTDPKNNRDKIKIYLQKLCSKYKAEYMNNSYYFIY